MSLQNLSTDMQLRKDEHINVCLSEDIGNPKTTAGLERYHFLHQALPEINLNNVDVGCGFLGKRLNMPLIIAPMTGGTSKGSAINILLAEAAQAHGIGLSLGSQRIMLVEPEVESSFMMRRYAPDVLIFANLGAIQLNNGVSIGDCQRLAELIEADVFTLHLNPIHEAIQPNGETNFAGLLPKIECLCKYLQVPVMVKEVGGGISADCAQRLVDVGVQAIDIAGAGGTSWPLVERYRTTDSVLARLANTFADWGIPTADCLRQVHDLLPEMPLVASGGIRTGVDVAKMLALGANVVSMAYPLLQAANDSAESLDILLQILGQELKIAMFGVGCSTIGELRTTTRLICYE